MTSIVPYQRRPLASRTLANSPNKFTRAISGSKRARSPDGASSIQSVKRARPAPVSAKDPQKEKKTEREQREAEFRDKYTRAFPSWIFYFDTERPLSVNEYNLRSRVVSLGAKIVEFFDKTVTHVITDAEIQNLSNSTELILDKENHQYNKPLSKRGATALRSPIKLVARSQGEKKNVAIQNAILSGMKIWNAVKLDSVLSRCLNVPISMQASTSQRPTLSKLLQDERTYGSAERDPNQKRHNYRYFTPGSCFVLIEDISQELATIAAHEYPIVKEKDANDKKPWPVLHCHPHSRNPFAPFDEKEKRRWEKQQQAENEAEKQRDQRRNQRQVEALKRKAQSKMKGDLRRSVSFNNIRRRYSIDNCIKLDSDAGEARNESSHLASAVGAQYIAASGNSVGVTSTTGTASSAIFRRVKLSSAIDSRIKNQVVTSLKASAKEQVKNGGDTALMGPPEVPKPKGLIKRSKSTNTMKLPKREEGAKPGYCESCRMKFSDFNGHVESKKHIKFASNPANFEALDFVIDKLRRRTRDEVEAEEQQRLAKLNARSAAICLRSSLDDVPSADLLRG